MQLPPQFHLAYCSNIHPGESWPATFAQIKAHLPALHAHLAPGQPFGIGLRLSARAAQELEGGPLVDFQRWLDREQAYVFTINGFPYGGFHHQRVKDQVFHPDWTTPERLEYTCRLFDLLAALLPPGVPSGSVSSLPGSFKGWGLPPEAEVAMFQNLDTCSRHLESLNQNHQLDLHLGLEPEPFGWFENTPESLDFFSRWNLVSRTGGSTTGRIGLTYDACHQALAFEAAADSLDTIQSAGIRLSKIHLSSALRLPDPQAHRHLLAPFADDTYLHQVIGRRTDGSWFRQPDLPEALNCPPEDLHHCPEWRIHCHIPLFTSPQAPLLDTRDHLLDTLHWCTQHPSACQHLEMETYTWGVLPPDLRTADLGQHLLAEYQWTLNQFNQFSPLQPGSPV